MHDMQRLNIHDMSNLIVCSSHACRGVLLCSVLTISKHPRHALTFHFQAASWLLKKSTFSSSGALKQEKSARYTGRCDMVGGWREVLKKQQ
jgi:hypothetical protein